MSTSVRIEIRGKKSNLILAQEVVKFDSDDPMEVAIGISNHKREMMDRYLELYAVPSDKLAEQKEGTLTIVGPDEKVVKIEDLLKEEPKTYTPWRDLVKMINEFREENLPGGPPEITKGSIVLFDLDGVVTDKDYSHLMSEPTGNVILNIGDNENRWIVLEVDKAMGMVKIQNYTKLHDKPLWAKIDEVIRIL